MTCCVVGGGPAGVMLGFLLARAGVDVTVLEKHADFFRDFRGDTIHPSTLNIMDELGLLDEFLQIPHSEVTALGIDIGGRTIGLAQFDRVPGRCKFIAFMPQWDFLNFLADRARRYPNFRLLMQTEVTNLVRQGERVSGVRAKGANGIVQIEADLVIACDGRHSILRQRAGLPVREIGAPIDVLWMRVSKPRGAPEQTFGNVAPGGILVAIDRRDYYQCAFVICKGGFDQLQARGIDALREDMRNIAPFLGSSVEEIRTWDDVKLLTVVVNRLERWSLPGLLCIGDAAHAMSPVGGVGINLAIQDAVAAANLLTAPLRAGRVPASVLTAVQRRREFATKGTQWLQVQVQNRVLSRVLAATQPFPLPPLVALILRYAFFRRLAARLVGTGLRPEHVHQNASI